MIFQPPLRDSSYPGRNGYSSLFRDGARGTHVINGVKDSIYWIELE